MVFANVRRMRVWVAACGVVLLLMLQVTAVSAARRAQAPSKADLVARLVALDATITTLRERLVADPTNARLLARLNAALAESEAVSAQLGGDRVPPANLGPDAERGNPGVPPSPPGCTAATASFSNSTPVPIPDNNLNGITSTVSVTGTGTYTYDVNVTVNITHTFPGDIDLTLTSPAGTTVTLTTDNATSNDNAFAGTTFDDDADPNSQIPYAGNPNIVSDHTYAIGVVVPTLTPEEGLAAFIGEDPTGTWTLKASDDAGIDTGTLNSWSVQVTTLSSIPNGANATGSNNTPVAIPDNDLNGITSTISISSAGTSIINVDSLVNITHTFPGDLDITLTSPVGTVVTLSTDNATSNDNAFAGTTFDDDADPNSQIPYAGNPNIVGDHTYAIGVVVPTLTPEEPLGAFVGEDPNGTWTLKVSDDAGIDTGTLNSWSLDIDTASCMVVQGCMLTCPPAQTVAATDPNGAVVNYPAPTTSGTCGTVTCSPASGSVFPVGTTTVTCTEAINPARRVTTVYSSGNIAVPIPDNNPTGASVTINVPDTGAVTDVNVRVRLNHTWDADLAIGLSHSNSGNALSNNRGGSGDNYGTGNNDCSGTQTVFDDQAVTPIGSGAAPFAGSFIPESGLSIHNGSDASGTWTLSAVDSAGADTGTIGCVELEITRADVTPGATCSFPVTVSIPFDSCCVDDYSGDTFQQVVANALPGSPLYGFWQYHVAATGETFSGTANFVAYRPGLSLVMRDTDSATVAAYAQIDYIRKTCLVQVTDRTTGRQFTLRDRNITNSTCGVVP